MFNIIGRRKLWYLISSLLIIPGVISLFVWRLPVGIDFAGGSLLEIQVKSKDINISQIREKLESQHLDNLAVQSSGDNQYLIKYKKPTNINKKDDVFAEEVIKSIASQIGETNKIRFETVGPTVSHSLTNKAIWSVIIASILIIIYIAYAFRGVASASASAWRLGVFAVVALIHDILFTTGMFAILGHYLPIFEVNGLFITALLTILGYSVNDTIVVYDRIRENLRRMPGRPLEEVTNAAVNQTLVRSLNTSLTLILVLITLLILGGPSIRSFLMALVLGTVVGTYSSIFIASPLLVTFNLKGKA